MSFPSSRLLSRYGVFLACLVGVACGVPHTKLSHPLETGQVERNLIQRGRMSAEINEFNADRICFYVRGFRELPDQEPLSGLQEPIRFHDGYAWRADVNIIEAYPEQQTVRNGTRSERYQAGTERKCERRLSNGRCTRWVNRPIYRIRLVPATYYGLEFGAKACFTNGGTLTLDTRDIQLEWAHQRFRWRFESLGEGE